MAIKAEKKKYGRNERYTFGHIKDTLEIPYLVEIQKDSYNSFITDGIAEVLKDFSPISDSDNLNREEEDKDSKIDFCKQWHFYCLFLFFDDSFVSTIFWEMGEFEIEDPSDDLWVPPAFTNTQKHKWTS